MKKILFFAVIIFPCTFTAQVEAFSAKYFSMNKIDSVYVSTDLLNQKGDTSMCLKEVHNYNSDGALTKTTIYRECKLMDAIKLYTIQEGSLHSIGTTEFTGTLKTNTTLKKNDQKKGIYKYTIEDQFNGTNNFTAEYDGKGQLKKTTQTDAKKKSVLFSTEYSYDDKDMLTEITEKVDGKTTSTFKISFSEHGKVLSMVRNTMGYSITETTYTYRYISENTININVTNKINGMSPRNYKYRLNFFKH
jgi:hypothetical protein